MEIKLNHEMSKKKEEDRVQALRHTASHILAQAMKRLYPSIKLAIGPATNDGFIMILIVNIQLLVVT